MVNIQKSKINDFSQVKKGEISISLFDSLISKFKIKALAIRAGIIKRNGITPCEIILHYFNSVINRSKSLHDGLVRTNALRYQTAIHDFMNNPYYDFRRLLLYVAKLYTVLLPAKEGDYNLLIIDDTAFKKTGKSVDDIAKFKDNSSKTKFYGYQCVTAVWSNGRTSIPIDFILKIGQKLRFFGKKAHYETNTHTFMRRKEAKQTKTQIVLGMLKRALKFCFKINYVLWDCAYNNSEVLDFINAKMIPRGIHLISAFKKSDENVIYKGKKVKIKDLCSKLGSWQSLPGNPQVKYKEVLVDMAYKKSHKKKKANARKPKNHTKVGDVICPLKICLYWFPGQKKNDYRAIISTDTKLSADKILDIYCQRWSIEIVFKDLKQNFGFNTFQATKYGTQIADVTLRMICYIMMCYVKDKEPKKISLHAIQLTLFKEYERQKIAEYIKKIMKEMIYLFLKFSVAQGYIDIKDVIENYDYIYKTFYDDSFFLEKIIEIEDNMIFTKPKNRNCKRINDIQKQQNYKKFIAK